MFGGHKDSGAWGMILNAATMGLHLVTGTFVGLAMGYFLEKWLCESEIWCVKPWLTLFFLVMGIIAGFKMIYEDVRRIQKAQAQEEQRERERGENRPHD